MEHMKHLEKIMDAIRITEGNRFQYDEAAILSEYGEKEGKNSNVIIKILSIFGGLLATLAFVVFLFILGIYDSVWGMLLLGIVLAAVAIVIDRTYNSFILDTFSVCFYVLGVILFALGLASLEVDENHVALLVILMALGSLAITQNYVISFISIITIGAAMLFLIMSYNIPDAIHGYLLFYTVLLTFCFLNEAKLLTNSRKLAQLSGPLRIGLVFCLLFGLVAVGKNGLAPISGRSLWISSVVSIGLILYLASKVLKRFGVVGKKKVLTLTLCFFTLLPTLFAPAISGALLIVLLSFWVNYKTGFVIGIIALIYFVIQYYYDLSMTLLTKSIILFSSGLVFLVFYFFFTQMTKTDEEV
ncbi:DUF4401 domain-containing protein [Flagellimonas taeanensis]|nr:DUF4401 domain-containing protein [Allomuricauda taeanensis]